MQQGPCMFSRLANKSEHWCTSTCSPVLNVASESLDSEGTGVASPGVEDPTGVTGAKARLQSSINSEQQVQAIARETSSQTEAVEASLNALLTRRLLLEGSSPEEVILASAIATAGAMCIASTTCYSTALKTDVEIALRPLSHNA